MTLCRCNERFSQSSQNYFQTTIIFVGLVESRGTSESEPSTFRVINIPKKPQAAMPSSFKMEVTQISPFCLPSLCCFLIDDFPKDGGPGAVLPSCSFHHHPLWYQLLYLTRYEAAHIHKLRSNHFPRPV